MAQSHLKGCKKQLPMPLNSGWATKNKLRNLLTKDNLYGIINIQ